MKITIIEELNKNDIEAWTFDISEDDYMKIVYKYLHDGETIRGTKAEVFADLMED